MEQEKCKKIKIVEKFKMNVYVCTTHEQQTTTTVQLWLSFPNSPSRCLADLKCFQLLLLLLKTFPKTGEESKYLSSELGEQVLFCGLRGKSWILLKFLHSKRQPEKVIGSGLSIWLLRTFLWYRFTLISSTCFGQQGLYFQSLRKCNFIQK